MKVQTGNWAPWAMVPARQAARVNMVDEKAAAVSHPRHGRHVVPRVIRTVEFVFQPAPAREHRALDLCAGKDAIQDGAEEVVRESPAQDLPATQPQDAF